MKFTVCVLLLSLNSCKSSSRVHSSEILAESGERLFSGKSPSAYCRLTFLEPARDSLAPQYNKSVVLLFKEKLQPMTPTQKNNYTAKWLRKDGKTHFLTHLAKAEYISKTDANKFSSRLAMLNETIPANKRTKDHLVDHFEPLIITSVANIDDDVASELDVNGDPMGSLALTIVSDANDNAIYAYSTRSFGYYCDPIQEQEIKL